MDVAGLDLLVVPGLAFPGGWPADSFGGGYYDRLLAQIETPTLSLSYHVNIMTRRQAEAHDQAVGRLC